jgi:GABA(A) receptor-associated protein
MDLVNNAFVFISSPVRQYQPSSSFRGKHGFKQRRDEADRVCAKYPDRVPIICEVSSQFKDQFNLDKSKYLVPNDLTVGQFIHVIRKRIKMDASQSLFMFINNSLPNTSSLISEIYREHADEDRFLYILISLESTFGSDVSHC